MEKRVLYVLTNHTILALEKQVEFLKWLRHAHGPDDRAAYSWIITDLSDLLEQYQLVVARLEGGEDHGGERVPDDATGGG